MDQDYTDGYNHYPAACPFGSPESFYAGWDAAWEDAQHDDLYDPWNDWDQGRYDDDPSPYDGNYSEM